jgi:hypothetical protein
VNRVKTDTRDAKRLALILENNDVPSACDVPDRERREDRQISRTLIAIQKDITRNRIRKFLDFHAIEVPFAGKDKWDRKEFRALKELPLCEPLNKSECASHVEHLVDASDGASGIPPPALPQGAVQKGL